MVWRWYGIGMSVQMTIRIPDDLAEFVDRQVEDGGKSRAAVITRALKREQRRKRAERDALIYASTEPDTELDEFVAVAAERLDLSNLD